MQKDTEEYDKLKTTELQRLYYESLGEYREWVDKKIDFNLNWDDEIFNIILTRDDLHTLALELESRGEKIDKSLLEKIDKDWKDWINKTRDPGYAFVFDRQDEPKSKWWWWLDQSSPT